MRNEREREITELRAGTGERGAPEEPTEIESFCVTKAGTCGVEEEMDGTQPNRPGGPVQWRRTKRLGNAPRAVIRRYVIGDGCLSGLDTRYWPAGALPPSAACQVACALRRSTSEAVHDLALTRSPEYARVPGVA